MSGKPSDSCCTAYGHRLHYTLVKELRDEHDHYHEMKDCMDAPDPQVEINRSDENELFGETEDDLADLSNAATFDALVVSTDWTTETLLNQITRGSIELDPTFQRRDAWDRQKKSRFVESLIVGLPVPQVVLAERSGKRGEYLVLDGKQRLLSIQQFRKGDFHLAGLDLRSDLNGLTYDQLPDSEQLALDNQTLRTIVVRNWKREEFLYLIFLRLNTANVPLSPQELRQALHPGPFVSFVNEFTADNIEFSSLLKKSTVPDFRMRDVELLVRYFAFTQFLSEYHGNLKNILDLTCETLNSRMKSNGTERIVREANQCLESIQAVNTIFQGDAFRRWNDGKDAYERQFNRAIFDVMTFYARQPEVRTAMLDNAEKVKAAFTKTCKNERFIRSITVTTKSAESVYDRISIWGASLGESLNLRLPILERNEDGRIAYKKV